MADLPPAQQAPDVSYRPISGLALVGFALSLLFTGIIALSTVVALVQGRPAFLPAWTLMLALSAAALCLVAQLRIRNAEGTVAGTGLARWGLWLSVLLGATYFVYLWITGLALSKQAGDFLVVKSSEDSGFFPRLMNSEKNRADLYQAFLLTLPTTSRGGSKASNEAAMLEQYDQPGKEGERNITNFSKHPIVAALRKSPEATIEPLGGLDWSFEKNSYRVARNYRFATPELILETTIPVQSAEGAAEGEQRKWFVNMAMIPRPAMTLTPLGEKVRGLRRASREFLEEWRGRLGQGAPAAPFPEADTNWSSIVPKYEAHRAHLKNVLGDIFAGRRKQPTQMMFTTDEMFATWTKLGDGRIQIVHPLKMALAPSDPFPAFLIELELTTTSKQPVDLTAETQIPVDWEMDTIRVQRVITGTKAGF